MSMATFAVCLLKPKGPLHLGEREGMREGTETFVHSDTIFSALCHSLYLLYGHQRLEQFLALCQSDSAPLRLSSAFIFIGDDKSRQFYLPVPRNQIPRKKEEKKIQFVEKEEWERLLAGKGINEDTQRFKLPESKIKHEDVPGVSISRLTGTVQKEGGFFHTGLVWLKDAGLFFLYDVHPDWQLAFESAIRVMCDEGIGGYRSVGKGCFYQPEFSQMEMELPKGGNGEIMLSLYYPHNTEVADIHLGYYELLERKGYVYSPANRSYRRKVVSLFAEGSVFPNNNRKGRLVDVTPESVAMPHRVYRNGLAFALPCMLQPERG